LRGERKMAAATGVLAALRAPRVLGMAVFDWAASLLAAAAVGHWVLRLPAAAAAWLAFLALWVAAGVAAHWLAGVPTTLGYYLGVSAAPPARVLAVAHESGGPA
jgi:hypothetical protein